MVLWEIIFHKMSFKDAIKHSYKMSLVTIAIMIISENLIMTFVAPLFSSHQMKMQINTMHGFSLMLIAMSFGFLLSLPYNYYQLQKTGKICHEMPNKTSM